MPKVKTYLRVVKTTKGHRVSATTKPKWDALTDSWGAALPTAAFAVVLDIPDEAFRRAEKVLAEIEVPEEAVEVAAEVEAMDDDAPA